MAGKPRQRPHGPELPAPPEHHWTLMEIAAAHRMTVAAVRAAIKRGELGAQLGGKAYTVPDSEYRAWLRNSSTKEVLHHG